MNNRTIFISLLLILISTSVHSQVSLKNNFLRIENEQMIQILSFDNNQVVPTSVFSKELNEELINKNSIAPVSYTHLRAHETRHDLVCRLLLEKKKKKK